MTLEIQGNDYKFIIDPEKAKGDNATQIAWTRRLNKQNKGLMNAADFYAFAKFAYKVLNHNGNQSIKDECNKLLKSIQQDFNDEHMMTGTGIYTKDEYLMTGTEIYTKKESQKGQVIHNKCSNMISEKGFDVEILTCNWEYNWKKLTDLIETKEGLKLVQTLFLTNDTKDKILDLITYLGDNKNSELDTRKKTDYSPVLLGSNGVSFNIGCNNDLFYEIGCARGVSYISEADAKKLTLSGIINEAYSTKFSEEQSKIFNNIDLKYNITPKN